jgi:hypothetical protein
MDSDPDPDPEKIMRIRIDPGIRIHNTGIYEHHSASLHLIFLKIYNFLIGAYQLQKNVYK